MAAVNQAAFDVVHELAEADICNTALSRAGATLMQDTDELTKQADFCRRNYAVTRDELLRIFPANFALRMIRIYEDTGYPDPVLDDRTAFSLERWTDLTATVTASATITGIPVADITDDMVGMEVSGTNIQPGSRVLSINTTTGQIVMDRPAIGAGTAITLHWHVMKVIQVNGKPESVFEVDGGGRSRVVLTDEASGSETLDYLDVKVVLQVIDPSVFDALFRSALILYLAAKGCTGLTGDKAKSDRLSSEFSSMLTSAAASSSEEHQVDERDDPWTSRAVGSGPSTARKY
jgi:hypothetical protein